MYDGAKIITGIGIFVVLVTLPIWLSLARGDSSDVPTPKPPEGKEHCVEAKEYMTSYHMDLLNTWRDSVVRDGNRLYDSQTYPGESYPMSLSDLSTNSCLGCHRNKQEFCDECHTYLGVAPYCWDCHVVPDDIQPGVQPKAVR